MQVLRRGIPTHLQEPRSVGFGEHPLQRRSVGLLRALRGLVHLERDAVDTSRPEAVRDLQRGWGSMAFDGV